MACPKSTATTARAINKSVSIPTNTPPGIMGRVCLMEARATFKIIQDQQHHQGHPQAYRKGIFSELGPLRQLEESHAADIEGPLLDDEHGCIDRGGHMRHSRQQLIARIEHGAEEHHLRRLRNQRHEPVPEVGDVVALLETTLKCVPFGMHGWLLYGGHAILHARVCLSVVCLL